MPIARRQFLQLAAAGLPVFHAASARAALSLPTNMRIICPYPAGDASDAFCRAVSESLRADFGRTVLVDNKPGGLGLIGLTDLARSPRDGSTIAFIGSQHVTLQTLQKKFDLLKNMSPITRINYGPMCICVPANSPYKTIEQLLKAMVDKPGTITYGSGGIGTPAHLGLEVLKGKVPGLSAVHVPFKAASESLQAVMAGQLDCAMAITATAFPLAMDKRIRVLAVTGNKRTTALPDVPTMTEKAVPGFVWTWWGGFAAPPGTPAPVLEELRVALVAAIEKPEMRKLLDLSSSEVAPSKTSAQFVQELQQEIDTQTLLIKQNNITMDS
ncbi:tripartite tricarboxylate transporter substrate binding protein [Variovorax rhizosphaerae]|uniref:Tripartite tricarboxylate transporter substrate binding protein n=1 Tax=Variovorax rhizosphaerae TaxID=1836200 RepID=A0ABU8WXS7_9BURK